MQNALKIKAFVTLPLLGGEKWQGRKPELFMPWAAHPRPSPSHCCAQPRRDGPRACPPGSAVPGRVQTGPPSVLVPSLSSALSPALYAVHFPGELFPRPLVFVSKIPPFFELPIPAQPPSPCSLGQGSWPNGGSQGFLSALFLPPLTHQAGTVPVSPPRTEWEPRQTTCRELPRGTGPQKEFSGLPSLPFV